AGAFVVTGFFLISTSTWGQDEPQTIRYAIRLNCSMGADGGQGALFFGYMMAVDKVWSMAPAGAWGRDLLVDLMADSNGKTIYDIYYSPQVERDKIFAESLQNAPGVSLVQIEEHGHLIMSELMRTGVLPKLFPPIKAAAG
ncbi:MAG: hypothetical protein ACT4N9_10365, partial [Paracoccaceae bacterium]